MSQDTTGGVQANNAGAAFRAALNTSLAAIITLNSGATAPTVTYAYMLWADTTTGLLKQRDSLNASWIVIGTMGAAYLGLLSLAGGNMTGPINEARTTFNSNTATPDVWTNQGNNVAYTNTTTVTGLAAAPQAGARRSLDVTTSPASFTTGANLLIDGYASGATVTAQPGDRVEIEARTTTVFVLRIKAAGGAQRDIIFPGTASVAGNALTVGLNPTQLDFRSSTLTTGVPNSRSVAAALSLTVPSGATLGTTNSVLARLFVLAIDNAGTVELAIVNQNGGVNLDETTLISTTAISGTSNSANVIYSQTARTNVPFRVVEYIEITEATAGTWATAPSLVQGIGGVAGMAMQSLGLGQTYQNVTGSRAIGSTYYNTTGRPIVVMVQCTATSASATSANPTVNGVGLAVTSGTGSGTVIFGTIFIVPPDASYSVSVGGGTYTYNAWFEMR